MAGAALSRLWDTNPKLAFVFHVISCLLVGLASMTLWLQAGNRAAPVIVTVFFVIDAALLVLYTTEAAHDGWTGSKSSRYSPGLPSPRNAWGSAQVREKVLWVLFAFAFLVGLVLGFAKSLLGLAFIILSIPLVVVAVRARK